MKRQFSVGYPKAKHTADWNIPLVFLWKRPIWLSWSFSKRDRLKVWTHLGDYTGQWIPSLHPPSASHLVIGISQKGAWHSFGALIFVTTAWETLLGCPALVASGTDSCGPIALYIFTYFKSCCLRVWLPISLNPGVDWDPLLQDTDKSGNTLNYGEPLNTK